MDPDVSKDSRIAGEQAIEPHFSEDEMGATLDSGMAVCRFNTQEGGRLQRWQWRTRTPLAAIHPAMRDDPPSLLDMVDPARGALIDHFLPLGTKPDDVKDGTHRELGDFAAEPYRSQVVNTGGEIRIGLLRDGAIRSGQRVADIRIAKSAAVRPGSGDVAVLYRIINSSIRPVQVLFAVELNLYPPGLDNLSGTSEGYYLIDGARPDDPALISSDVSPGTTHLALVNPLGEMALQVGWDRECDLWRMPIAEGEPGVRLLSVWRVQLPPRDNWAMGLWLAPG